MLLLRDSRGAAYVESLVAMPVFISLFAAIGFFTMYYGSWLDQANRSRRCAWEYSNGGCSAVPGECAGVVGAPQQGTGETAETQQIRSELRTFAEDIPLPGAQDVIEAILGTSTTAVAREQVPLPDWVGGGTRPATCTQTVLCNEREQTLGGILRNLFCGAVTRVPGVSGAARVFGCS